MYIGHYWQRKQGLSTLQLVSTIWVSQKKKKKKTGHQIRTLV